MGILAALHHREETGEGQHVEVNLLSSAMSAMVNQTAAYTAAGVVPWRMGNADLSVYPYEPLATRDRNMFIAAVTTGSSARSPRRSAHRNWPTTSDSAASATATTTGRSCGRCCWSGWPTGRPRNRSAILTKAGIPCGPINDVRGGVELAESLGLEPVVMTGDVPTVRNPIRMSATPPRHELPPPALDADGDDIRAWLGFDPAK